MGFGEVICASFGGAALAAAGAAASAMVRVAESEGSGTRTKPRHLWNVAVGGATHMGRHDSPSVTLTNREDSPSGTLTKRNTHLAAFVVGTARAYGSRCR